MREIPPFLLTLERVLDTLDATQEVPRHTRLHWSGTQSIPPQLKKSPVFPSSSRDEGPFPCFIGKGIPAFPLHLMRKRSPLDTRDELQESCHHFKRPRCPNGLQIHLTPLLLTQQSPRGPTENRMAGVTALWHHKKCHRSLCQPKRKPDAAIPAREESGRACLHTRRGLTPLWKHQSNPEFHVSTGEET